MLGNVHVSSVRVPLEDVWDSSCRHLYEYWNQCRGDNFAPTWTAFELSDLPPDCIRYSHVVDLHQTPFDITFRFWGTELTDVLFYDRTGESLLSTNMGYLEDSRRRYVMADYLEMLESQQPAPFLWDASATHEHTGKLVVPSLRVPISNNGVNVTQVATHFDFTDKRDTWENLFQVHQRASVK